MYNGMQENTHLYFFIARAPFWLRVCATCDQGMI